MKHETLDYKFYKYSILTLMMFISALNFNFFINPAKIVAGGVNGIAVILETLFKLKPATVILLISIFILTVAFVFKENEMLVSALYASLVYPLFVNITAPIALYLEIQRSDLIIISILSGALSGVVAGFTCKYGLSQGGITLISQILNKKLKMSISHFNLIINMIIVLIGGFVFGLVNIMYALIFLYSSKIVMDRIILGISQKKVFYIITTKDKDIKNFISKDLEFGYTILNARGGYNNKKQSVIMTTIPTRDYFRLKEGIHEIDPEAFFVITDSYQVEGGK